MTRELVSVVIPTYNRARSIERAVDSVLAQTHSAVEVLVVDDGSTDDTAHQIAKRYGTDPRVRYLHQANRGVSAARNAGLDASGGDFVALLDSDDEWKPWKLALQLAVMRALPDVGMVWTDMEAIGPEGELVETHYLRTMYATGYRWFPGDTLFPHTRQVGDIYLLPDVPEREARVFWGDIFSAMVMGNLVHTSTVLLRRERLRLVGGFNEDLKVSGEDYDFHLRTCREGPVAFVNAASIRYQIGRSDQLSHRAFAIHMARNFLTTVTSVLARDRERIHLPRHMITAVQAFAHGWVGAEYVEIGEPARAREHLWRSLRYNPWQPKTWLYGLIALFPPVTGHAAVRWLHAVKRWIAARHVS